MPRGAVSNFVAGETSPKSRGRFDLPWFAASCEKLLNYIPEVPGSARFRPGFKTMRQTRGGAAARMIPFRLNDEQNYMLEFTDGFLRARRQDNYDLVQTERTTLTAVTRASPCVITVASTTGLADGDEIIITGAEGMLELNGQQVKLANKVGSTYQLVDPVTGENINSSDWGVWTSGGTVSEVFEVASPYLEADLDQLQWVQTVDTLYIVHPRYDVRKVTVTTGHAFTIGTYSRTNDPFGAALPVLNLTSPGVTLSGTRAIVYLDGPPNEDALYTFAAVGGTTQLNGNTYRLEIDHSPSPYNAAFVNNADGSQVNASAWTFPWTANGTATPVDENPVGVALYEGRLVFLGTNQRPDCFFASAGPDPTTGDSRYDDFTGGTGADDACFFAISPVDGKKPVLAWGRGGTSHLFAGAYGGPFRISGPGLDEPITADTVPVVRQMDGAGCEAVMPAGGPQVYFIQRGGKALRTIVYDERRQDLGTRDMMLNAEHMTDSPLERVVLQAGRPDVLWAKRADGVLVGATVHEGENVTGWHRHKIGGVDATVVDVQVWPRPADHDQLLIVSRRVIGGAVRHFVEYLADPVDFLDREEFYAGGGRVFADAAEETPGWFEAAKEDDVRAYRAALYRRQEEYVHLDAASTYNGADRGADAEATLTPGATTGDDVTFTASAAVFKSTDVGNELWKKPNRDTGIGAGRAVITAYVSPTQVTCDIEVDFDSASAIEAGEWHIAADVIRGLWHMEGSLVAVVTDGGVYTDGSTDGDADYAVLTVENGAITLEKPAAVVHVGLPYLGVLKTHNLGGLSVPRQIVELNLRLLWTLGVDYGTDPYKLERVQYRSQGDALDRPSPPFSGVKKLEVPDTIADVEGKHVYIVQRLPLPCIVQQLDLVFAGGEERAE